MFPYRLKDTDKSVAIAVIDRHHHNLLLVEQKESSKWGIPKGHLEWNERPWAGAVRELQEETNLSLKLVRHRLVSRNGGLFTVQLLEDFHELRPDPNEISQVHWQPISSVRLDAEQYPNKYNMWVKIFFKNSK